MIGTIPLQENWPQQASAPPPAQSSELGTGITPALPPEPGMQPTAPPSYDESKQSLHISRKS